VNNLPKVEREAPRPGIEPATSRLQVRRPNHYATTPHYCKTINFGNLLNFRDSIYYIILESLFPHFCLQD